MSIVFNKSVNTHKEIVGNELTYTLFVKNTTPYKLTSVVVSDILNESLSFVLESVTINNIEMQDANILSGIELAQ